ncbi:MerR family transcriptional regulator [Tunicatimonas pelagia]|uniref:MerR family transcriptional regulator n=1 Tax=Tunicatimonas pelagia TaxID=931531 RepID=UPI0026662C6A|nr:MerR family transcriptional regulator [Tunicatimonas pelagia]WKN42881.1 MerR family transcriptional regulator [Tunicatimonas pelagia]
MSHYSIKDIEQLSGIKAHTLRIWEQRYQFILPKRTDTNIRYYDNDDLKLVLNIALLKDNGYKISKIAQMDHQQMRQEVLNLTEKNLRYPDQINTLILAMVDLDEDRFEKIMATNILKLGFESTMINVVYPFLSKIGILWQTGAINPAQEHFITNLIRQKLIVAIDGQYVSINGNTDKYLLYLPEGELHEITLLFICYLIKVRQQKVVYFGQNLPFADLESIYSIHQPDYILTIITTSPSASEVQGYVNRLSTTFPEAQVLLSGYQIIGQDVATSENTHIFTRIEHFISFIEENKLEKTA